MGPTFTPVYRNKKPRESESESEQKERAEKRKATEAEFHKNWLQEREEFAKSEAGVFMREQHEFRAEQKAREQTKPAEKRQRSLPQEIEDLTSKIRRVNLLPEEDTTSHRPGARSRRLAAEAAEAKTSVEEVEHAVQMFNVALNISTQDWRRRIVPSIYV